MDDLFSELIVERKPRAQDTLLKVLFVAAILLTGASGILFAPVFLIVFLGLILAAYFLWPRFRVEYEYSYVNGQVDIAKIFSKQSRKDVAKIELSDALCVAPLGSHELDAYGETYKTVDYSSGDPALKPYVVVKGGEEKRKILLHLDDGMVTDLKRRYPRQVFLY